MEKISTKPTSANISKIMALLTDMPVKFAGFSEGLSDEQLSRPLGSGERSFIEELAHLLNCEARSAEAIYLALLANEPIFVNIHPERQLGKLLRYDQFSVSELLAYFTFRRTVLLRVLASLTEKQWSRTIREEGKKRQESVYWQIRSLALHEFEHVSDIERKLSEMGYAKED
jgi:hypothetical protein